MKYLTYPIISLVLTLSFIFLKKNSEKDMVHLNLPSLNKDFRLSSKLTYSAIMLLRDTSAKLFYVDENLKIKGELVKSFKHDIDYRVYNFSLDKSFKSAAGEAIDAFDVEESILRYLTQVPALGGMFKNIKGAKDCLGDSSCQSIEGLVVKDSYHFDIHLSSSDSTYIDQLSSPWFIITKKDKEFYSKIDDCIFPYPTGKWQVKSCFSKGIVLASPFYESDILVQEEGVSRSEDIIRVTADNPAEGIFPSLTVLSFYANPKSKNLSSNFRKNIIAKFYTNAERVSENLKLNQSITLAPRWMGLEMSKSEISLNEGTLVCPNEKLKVQLDSSIPNHDFLRSFVEEMIPCPVSFNYSKTTKFFDIFKQSDFSFIWFTPNFIYFHNIYGIFDCGLGGMCYFDWKDPVLQNYIEEVEQSRKKNIRNLEIAAKIEKHLLYQGYVSPLADMMWWIVYPDGKSKAIHPAGLFQMKVSDVLR